MAEDSHLALPVVEVRRLVDQDVRDIFECLHLGKPPPPHLPFRIVPVGPNGLRLSPPSHEFPDGLFVLLRPRGKGKNSQSNAPRPPPHLAHLLVLDDDTMLADTCPWSLSGPQFPPPTAIQQRYCYPRGRPLYSGQKGGALWTMYRRDGKEDLTYRLLHVYYSAKRAVNSGSDPAPPAPLSPPPLPPLATSSPAKRAKAIPDGAASLGPSRDSISIAAHPATPQTRSAAFISPTLAPKLQYHLKSPSMTPNTLRSPSPAASDSFDSHLSFAAVGGGPSIGADSLSDSTFHSTTHHRKPYQQQQHTFLSHYPNFVSPYYLGANGASSYSLPQHRYRRGLLTIGGSAYFNGNIGNHHDLTCLTTPVAPCWEHHLPVDDVSTGLRFINSANSNCETAGNRYADPFSYDLTDGSVAASEDDLDWDDESTYGPLRPGIAFVSGHDEAPVDFGDHLWDVSAGKDDESSASSTMRRMARKLDLAHGGLRDAILAAPGGPERAALVNALAHWARNVASDPLVSPRTSLLPTLPAPSGPPTTFTATPTVATARQPR